MHWIKAWRMQHLNERGLPTSRLELARMIRKRPEPGKPETEIGRSENLIAILEGGGITHPEIANRIAEVLGATQEQRDSIVHKMHRGKWQPPQKRKRKEELAQGKKLQPMMLDIEPDNARMVARISIGGFETGRFISMMDAAKATGCSTMIVHNRCARKLRPTTDEFNPSGYTFRFADEWDAMTPEERLADIRGRLNASTQNCRIPENGAAHQPG